MTLAMSGPWTNGRTSLDSRPMLNWTAAQAAIQPVPVSKSLDSNLVNPQVSCLNHHGAGVLIPADRHRTVFGRATKTIDKVPQQRPARSISPDLGGGDLTNSGQLAGNSIAEDPRVRQE